MAAVKRQLPRWSEVRPLLQMDRPDLNRNRAALRRAQTVEDLRRIALRRVPRAVFDYVDGGSEQELTLRRAREAFDGAEFRARVLRNVEHVDTTTDLFGQRCAAPVVLGPTGYTRMMHHEGESAVAAAAAEAGLPYTLSTVGTTTIEDVAAVQPTGPRWFQLYPPRDRARIESLVGRAADAGYEALMLTVDTAVAGRRLRDNRNGLTVPPTLTAKTIAQMALRPRWWMNVLSTPPLGFANLPSTADGQMGAQLRSNFNPTISYDDLRWLRTLWDGPLLVKGIQHADDAVQVFEAGADAVVLSNHGGRQLDRSIVPLRLLPEVRERVGKDPTVLIDGGVLSGSDVITAVALGADAVVIGKAYLYGLMAGGQAGVTKALDLITSQVATTMQLLGAGTLADLSPDLVELPPARPLPT